MTALSEFGLIYRFFADLGRGEHTVMGVGDDAAVLALTPGFQLVTSTDSALEGIHFPVDTLPEHVAYRSVAAAVSDLAAMGAEPLGMTLALSLPDADELWLHSFRQGLGDAVSDFHLPLVGGDTTRGSLALTVTVFGQVPADTFLTRGGARSGDQLCVSGYLGDGAGGLALLQGDLCAVELDYDLIEALETRFYRPSPRLALGQALRGCATAAIDISDGLLADAQHIAHASGVELHIASQSLPISPSLKVAFEPERCLELALRGGDDYELLFTLPMKVPPPEGVTVIGDVKTASSEARVLLDGQLALGGGYEHFS